MEEFNEYQDRKGKHYHDSILPYTIYSAQNNSRPSVNFRAYCLKDRQQLHLGGYYVQTYPIAVVELPRGYLLPLTQV